MSSNHADRIKTAVDRNTRALELRPAVGRGTAVTRVKVREGLTCEVEEGPWKLTVDMSDKWGGNNQGPNPGVLGRAALGSCLAIGYVTWAAKLGVPLTSVAVEIQADYDSGGSYGVGDAPPDYREVRYVVSVESAAAESEVRRVLDEAERHSPYLAVFGRPQKLRRELRLSAATEGPKEAP